MFTLTTLNVRLLADGRLAARAYGRPADGRRGACLGAGPALGIMVYAAEFPLSAA
jgi:hypothetical protein